MIFRPQHSDLECRDWRCDREASRGAVPSVAYSPDGRHITSGSEGSTIRIWGANNGATDGKPLDRHTDSVLYVAFLFANRFSV
jgi:WD40 repeat protein